MRGGSSGKWLGLAGAILLGLWGPPPAAASDRLPLSPRLGALGLREEYRDTEPPQAVFSNRWRQVEVEANSRRILQDGVLVYLNAPVLRVGSAWTVDKTDWTEGVGFPWIAAPVKRRRKVDLVLLDPGHGGADKGAISPRRLEESRVTLDVARRVARLLERRGIAVKFTRDRDTFVSLEQRIALNRKLLPDAFVSIHVNATANPAIRGVESYVMTTPGFASTAGGKEDAKSYDGNRNGLLNMRLAHAVQTHLLDSTEAADRGVKRARFAVLKGSRVPAVLVEMGFLSHEGEEGLMISRAYRDRIAAGIARGILSYLTTSRKPPAPAKQEG
ncbi:MAG: N-acetylmuramoyl-L-alanine amidase [Kiritimatiellia bacterium]